MTTMKVQVGKTFSEAEILAVLGDRMITGPASFYSDGRRENIIEPVEEEKDRNYQIVQSGVKVSLEKIIFAVCDAHSVTEAELLNRKTKIRRISNARAHIYYLARTLRPDLTLGFIQQRLNVGCHSNIIAGAEVYKKSRHALRNETHMVIVTLEEEYGEGSVARAD